MIPDMKTPIPLDDSDYSFSRFKAEMAGKDKDQRIKAAKEEIAKVGASLGLNRPPMSQKLIDMRIDMAAKYIRALTSFYFALSRR